MILQSTAGYETSRGVKIAKNVVQSCAIELCVYTEPIWSSLAKRLRRDCSSIILFHRHPPELGRPDDLLEPRCAFRSPTTRSGPLHDS